MKTAAKKATAGADAARPNAPAAPAKQPLGRFCQSIVNQPDFARALADLKAGHSATIGGVWGSSCALLAATLAKHAPSLLLVIHPHADDVDDFLAELELFTAESSTRFPAWETNPRERLLYDEIYGDRLRVLKLLSGGKALPKIIGTSIQSLLQPTPPRERLAANTRSVAVNGEHNVDDLARWLVESGFHATSAIELPGEFSHRGGILDVFAADQLDPVRIEFFGDTVESIRSFEVATQRSLGTLDRVEITALAASDDDREHLCNYLPNDAWILLIEPSDLEDEGKHYLERLDRPQDFHSVATTMREVTKFPNATASSINAGSLETTCQLPIESVERFSGDVNKVRDELDALSGADAHNSLQPPALPGVEPQHDVRDHTTPGRAGGGHETKTPEEIHVVCGTEAETTRLRELFGTTQLALAGKLFFPRGRLKNGFRIVSERVAFVSASELFHRTDLARTPRSRKLGRVIDSFLELREGDYVVHLTHGIGRYRGLKLLDKEGQAEEHLVVEFHGETKIYVPASKIELVQKYVGGSKVKPTLAHIGGASWSKQKKAAEEAVNDLAAEMLELQARRAARPGIAFGPATPWQQEFDASFPYTETPDQVTAIKSIQADMTQTRPMDRLLCGDVGFGKTEVAMRAAFKAIDAGYQVAVLVPTTILCEQHLRTFTARMAEFPFTIRSLNRFCTAKEERSTLRGAADGAVDIVIGTHRLAGNDVKFHNLGLLIIDEEQRFGVEVKEKLKALRSVVDVLTMTATPIPRTLHLSLLGLRDISNLETPPADRIAVETRVARFEPDMLRHAILRELNRGGQVYFVHNRVKDLHVLERKLKEIVPEATIGIGHGQMAGDDLEEVMLGFVQHKFDILLATTIVESGLDIPNANTIFIDEADQYGLADLHQLRGRVGRYKHRAYCYLLIDPARHLSTTAAKRLRAIEEFSEMGAGFAISMRDLELRGAGNLLGTQQSGHIATVGYELYCELLEKAVRAIKKMPPKETVDVNLVLPGEAFFPRGYVPDMRLKIDIYRRISRSASEREIDEIAAELSDRFGARPMQVERMLSNARLRVWCHAWQIESVHLEEAFVVFSYTSRPRIEKLAKWSGNRLRVVDERQAYLPVPRGLLSPEQIFAEVKSLLRPEAAAS